MLISHPMHSLCATALAILTLLGSASEQVLAADHDSLQAAWFSEREASLSEREQQRDAKLRELWASDATLPAPIARYTFDAPFGFIEPNAAGAGYEAYAWRNSHQGAAAKREPGLFGHAIRHADRGAIDSLFPADKTFTVSFWIKPERRYAKSLFACEELFAIGIDRFKDRIFAQVGEKSISGPIVIGEWSNITLTHDGSQMCLFVNGKSVGSAECPLAENPLQKKLRFACYGGPHGQFEGLMDEVRICDDALNAEHIATIADAKQALSKLPPVADAGVDHSLYLSNQLSATLTLNGRTSGQAASSQHWHVVDQPAGAKVSIANPDALNTEVSFTTPGDYTLALQAKGEHGNSVDTTTVVVFPPHRQEGPAKLIQNTRTFVAEGDLYTDEFIAKNFPEIPPKLITEGLAKDRFKAPPPAYQHPRIFFNHSDLTAMRERLRTTKAGRSAMAQVRTWYEMRTRDNGGIPTDYFLPKKNNSGETVHTYDFLAAQMYCNGAFIAMIDGNTTLARKLIDGAMRCADSQLARIAATPPDNRGFQGYGNGVLGRYATAYIYDFLYPWMTPDERAKLRGIISEVTREVYSIGMFSVPGGHGASNWVCWVTGDLLTCVTAIEGEDGFDPVVYKEAAKAMNNFYTFGIKPDGSSFEGMGKNSITGEELMILAKRGEMAVAYENIYNHVANFYLHVMQPFGHAFISDDLWGTSRHPLTPSDAAVVKWAYPDDPVIDFVYRNIVGEKYRISRLDSSYVYTNGLVNCWVAQDWQGDPDWNTHAKTALGKVPPAQHFNYTNIATARSAWHRDAAYLYFVPRLHGGHRAPARGAFVFSALGRDWSIYPSGHNQKSSLQHSVITVDDTSYTAESFGRMIAFDDNDQRMIAACDLRHLFVNKNLPTNNHFRLNPAPEPWHDLPTWQMPHWQKGYKPTGEEAPRTPLRPDARSAFRAVSLVRGEQPYALIVDDMDIDNRQHHYRWQMVLPEDLQEQVTINGHDAIITDPATGHRLLLRLHRAPKGARIIAGKNSMDVWALAVEAEAIAARFEIILIPLRKGQAAPEDHSTLPHFASTLADLQKTISNELAHTRKQKTAKLETLRAQSKGFDIATLGKPLPFTVLNMEEIKVEEAEADETVVDEAKVEVSTTRGYLGQAYQFDGSKVLNIQGSLPPLGKGQPFTMAMWVKSDKGAGSLYTSGGHRGLMLYCFQGKSMAIAADNNWRWHLSPDHTQDWWCHLVITYDGETLSCFENGELIHSAPYTYASFGKSDPGTVEIGKGHVGKIEDLRSYDKALTPEQIRAWYKHSRAEYIEQSLNE